MLSDLNGLIVKQLGRYVSAEFLDALKSGNLRLSEAFVVPYVRGALAGESQVQVGAVALGEEGLQVELLWTRMICARCLASRPQSNGERAQAKKRSVRPPLALGSRSPSTTTENLP